MKKKLPDFKEYSFEEQELIKKLELLDKSTKYCDIKVSNRHKIKMNRMFREKANCKELPFPEVDNIWERLRSKLVIMLFGRNK